MVTASHNPPQDNGYKVYLGDGSQIVPPADSRDRLARSPRSGAAGVHRRAAVRGKVLDEAIVDRYYDTVADLAGDGPRDLDIVYTPLHGVGGTLGAAGRSRRPASPRPPSYPSRRSPTPTSPPSPSPTRRRQARWTSRWRSPPSGAPTSSSPTTPTPTAAPPRCPGRTGGGCCAATRWARCSARTSRARRDGRLRLLDRVVVAARQDRRRRTAQPYEETLTGFKWIARVPGLAFGYEEALGYCCDPEHVRDKDGVSALLMLCELAASAKAAGRSPHRPARRPRPRARPARHRPAVRARQRPGRDRRRDGAAACRSPDDARRPRPSSRSTTSPLGSASLPPTDGLRYHLADDARVIVRPVRHRAEAQGLPRGGHPGPVRRRRRRRRRRPHLRRRPPRRHHAGPPPRARASSRRRPASGARAARSVDSGVEQRGASDQSRPRPPYRWSSRFRLVEQRATSERSVETTPAVPVRAHPVVEQRGLDSARPPRRDQSRPPTRSARAGRSARGSTPRLAVKAPLRSPAAALTASLSWRQGRLRGGGGKPLRPPPTRGPWKVDVWSRTARSAEHFVPFLTIRTFQLGRRPAPVGGVETTDPLPARPDPTSNLVPRSAETPQRQDHRTLALHPRVFGWLRLDRAAQAEGVRGDRPIGSRSASPAVRGGAARHELERHGRRPSSDGTQHDRSVRHASGGGVARGSPVPLAAGERTPPARRCAA